MNKQAEVSGEVKSTESYFEILAKKCPHLCVEIFGYLNAKDLKECFLVNKQCNAIIGKAPKCMEKFVLKFRRWEGEEVEQEDKKQGLLMSRRNYQNIELRDVDIDRHFEEIFKKGKGKWKLVKFNNCEIYCYCEIDSDETFKIIIESICQTVEELTWHFSFYFHHQNVLDRIFNFPKLKKLKIWANRFPDLLATCHNLTKFYAYIFDEEDEMQVERVQQLLKRNPELKVMELRGSTLAGVFDRNFWKNIPFKLDDLTLELYVPPSRFMAHFLETQINTLKVLSICGGFDLICLEVIFRMRELKKLEILDFVAPWILDWNALALPQNNSIEVLDLRQFVENNDIVEALIRTLPNVKHLGIFALNDRIFNFLSINLSSLESMMCWSFRVSAARVLAGDAFPNLEELDADYHSYTEEELEQLRTEPTNQNQVHALLRDRLQYMEWEILDDDEN